MEVILFPGFISPMFSESIVCIKLLREDEGIIRNVAWLEIGNLDGSGEDEDLNTETLWIACYLIDMAFTFLDTFYSFLSFQGNDYVFLIFCGRIGIVVGLEGKLGGIFVSIVIIHAIDISLSLVSLNAGVSGAVVPGDVFIIDELALALLIPDGAFGLVDAYDIDGIM